MGERTPFSRRHKDPLERRSGGIAYPLFVGSCALLALLAVLSSDKVPTAIQKAATAFRNRMHDHKAAFAYYPNCDAARAAGVAPIRAGEPGYRSELDADDDGIACEPYRGMSPLADKRGR